MLLASYKSAFESLTPRLEENKAQNNCHKAAKLEEEEALREERVVGNTIADEISVDDIGKNWEETIDDCNKCDVDIWAVFFALWTSTKYYQQSCAHNHHETEALVGVNRLAEEQYAKTNWHKWRNLAEDCYVNVVAFLNGFVIEDGTDNVYAARQHQAQGIAERHHKYSTTKK